MKRSTLAALGLIVLGSTALATTTRDARATGMHGHVWSSQCALERLPAGRLKALLEGQKTRLDNGSFFPDSGYAAKHAYGETAHWEQFIDGYVKWLRSKHADPVKDAPQHVAFMMGAASHGLVDQTFDILFMDRARELDGPTDDLDTSMDVFLAVERKYVPELAYDAKDLASVFGDHVPLEVPESEIVQGMDLARVGMGFVTEILWKGSDERGKQYPWARASYQDARIPGSYPWGAAAVVRYWESILRRLDGDTSAEALVLASDPEPNGVAHGLAAAKMDSWVTLFVGYGLKRPSLTAESFYVLDAAGAVVPTTIRIRGDELATTLQLKPQSDWAPSAKYTLVLDTAVETVDGTHPTKRFELPFTTPCAGCATTPTGPAPSSPCPATLVSFPRPKDDEEPTPVTPAAPAAESSGGCGVPSGTRSAPLLLGLVVALLVARRRA